MPEFKHEDGRVISAYEGSPLEEAFRGDPEWTEVEGKAKGKKAPAKSKSEPAENSDE